MARFVRIVWYNVASGRLLRCKGFDLEPRPWNATACRHDRCHVARRLRLAVRAALSRGQQGRFSLFGHCLGLAAFRLIPPSHAGYPQADCQSASGRLRLGARWSIGLTLSRRRTSLLDVRRGLPTRCWMVVSRERAAGPSLQQHRCSPFPRGHMGASRPRAWERWRIRRRRGPRASDRREPILFRWRLASDRGARSEVPRCPRDGGRLPP